MPWWGWGPIWVLSPVVKVGGKQPSRPETDEQTKYIRVLCDERGISRREAITEALGEYQRGLYVEDASDVIDWLLEH